MQLRRWIALWLAFVLLFGLAACSGDDEPSAPEESSSIFSAEPDPEYPVMVDGVVLDARPGRVLSLAPAITEKLCDLGYESRISGISDYCDYPVSILNTPRYGTAQLPDVNEILALNPHVVFSATQLSVDATKTLTDAGIPIVVLSHAFSLAELEETYLTLSMLMDGRTSGKMIGEKFVEDLEAQIDAIASIPAQGEPKPAIYLRMLDFTVATGNTLEGELLERIGFVNIASGQKTRWVFDPQEAQSTEGRALFESVEMIFCDERDVSITMLEKSAFYKRLNCVLKDLYIYIDCAVFERQSLRMLEQLALMATGK